MDPKVTKQFYEAHSERLLLDYINGNPRVYEAVSFSTSWIKKVSGDLPILELGCGIGSVAQQIALATERKVFGVDLSVASIEIGKKLFVQDQLNLNLTPVDVLEDTWPVEKCDVILMVDFFEHIPVADRVRLYKKINSVLSDSGIILLTCPSPGLQKRLLRDKSEELQQPVDEVVNLEDLMELAAYINGGVIYFSHKSIWRPNDYFHAVVAKNNFSLPINDNSSAQCVFENRSKRWLRVLRGLDRDKLPDTLKRSNYFRWPLLTKVIAKFT